RTCPSPSQHGRHPSKARLSTSSPSIVPSRDPAWPELISPDQRVAACERGKLCLSDLLDRVRVAEHYSAGGLRALASTCRRLLRKSIDRKWRGPSVKRLAASPSAFLRRRDRPVRRRCVAYGPVALWPR